MSGPPVRVVAVLGVGTVGQSWAALFLTHGLRVRLWDPAALEGLKERFFSFLLDATLERPLPDDYMTLVTVCETLPDALEGAGFVQESGPEEVDVKRMLLQSVDALCSPSVIVGSSTSSFLLKDIVCHCSVRPERIVLSHPFNPPHLIPLVELFGMESSCVAAASSFYQHVGRHPIRMRKQLPGHVANRLTSALFREAVWMLREGVASAEDIDAAMCMGPGIRFAHMGPFQTYHLAAGNGGIAQYLRHLGPSQEARWKSLGTDVSLDGPTKAKIISGVQDMTDGRGIQELAAERDRLLMVVLAAKRQRHRL